MPFICHLICVCVYIYIKLGAPLLQRTGLYDTYLVCSVHIYVYMYMPWVHLFIFASVRMCVHSGSVPVCTSKVPLQSPNCLFIGHTKWLRLNTNQYRALLRPSWWGRMHVWGHTALCCCWTTTLLCLLHRSSLLTDGEYLTLHLSCTHVLVSAACIYIYIYIYAYEHVRSFPDTGCMHRPCEHRLRLRLTHTRIHVCVYTCVHVHVHELYIYIYICMYIFWGRWVSRQNELVHMCVFVLVRVCICACVCVCVYATSDTTGCFLNIWSYMYKQMHAHSALWIAVFMTFSHGLCGWVQDCVFVISCARTRWRSGGMHKLTQTCINNTICAISPVLLCGKQIWNSHFY